MNFAWEQNVELAINAIQRRESTSHMSRFVVAEAHRRLKAQAVFRREPKSAEERQAEWDRRSRGNKEAWLRRKGVIL